MRDGRYRLLMHNVCARDGFIQNGLAERSEDINR
jgi:hypothetical protein